MNSLKIGHIICCSSVLKSKNCILSLMLLMKQYTFFTQNRKKCAAPDILKIFLYFLLTYIRIHCERCPLLSQSQLQIIWLIWLTQDKVLNRNTKESVKQWLRKISGRHSTNMWKSYSKFLFENIQFRIFLPSSIRLWGSFTFNST